MLNITYQPIGIVHSPFKTPEGTPIQPVAAKDVCATIEIFPQYAEGLKDMEGFSHIYVLFHLHLAKSKSLLVTPFLDTEQHGVFATRAPGRPNSIGISVVCLLDGSPVLDIKPYIPQFDVFETFKNGWFDKVNHKIEEQKDDGRFKI
ncbi:MAG: tRNA (N6-threonylcarbamoyladenosine(37)-N6)-methyltransferase TrmO [Bacteroidia bacterium]|nr:tRNA (N6-threonylcarbamoyladenosine(37)-N6)-methyltransferase TrmO [Bacteroidia bacterium]